jgi:hypothetical protein
MDSHVEEGCSSETLAFMELAIEQVIHANLCVNWDDYIRQKGNQGMLLYCFQFRFLFTFLGLIYFFFLVQQAEDALNSLEVPVG